MAPRLSCAVVVTVATVRLGTGKVFPKPDLLGRVIFDIVGFKLFGLNWSRRLPEVALGLQKSET